MKSPNGTHALGLRERTLERLTELAARLEEHGNASLPPKLRAALVAYRAAGVTRSLRGLLLNFAVERMLDEADAAPTPLGAEQHVVMTFYSVVRLVPDVAREEFLNVGLVLWQGTRKAVALELAGENPDEDRRRRAFYPDWDKLVDAALRRMLDRMSIAEVRGAAVDWCNCVQLSAPRAALVSLDNAVRTLTPLYLGHVVNVLPEE